MQSSVSEWPIATEAGVLREAEEKTQAGQNNTVKTERQGTDAPAA